MKEKHLLEEFGLTEKELRRLLRGIKRKPRVIKRHITDEEFVFGVVSDTHLGSKFESLDELYTMYKIFQKVGIKEVFHGGDVLQGQKKYRGWEMETGDFGDMAQVDYCCRVYPKIEGIKTYFITGNHDACFWKADGIDIGELIANKREDMVYIGQYQGDVVLNGIKIRMIHPDGGMPYALSYRAQKVVEQIPSGTKPHILIVGHLHTAYYFPYRLIHIIGGGSFQRQTPFLLRKGINPTVGGWVVKVRPAKYKKRSVVAINPGWIPFF